nr:Uncharacterised protein [Raoultella sp. NCTC 9187]
MPWALKGSIGMMSGCGLEIMMGQIKPLEQGEPSEFIRKDAGAGRRLRT